MYVKKAYACMYMYVYISNAVMFTCNGYFRRMLQKDDKVLSICK